MCDLVNKPLLSTTKYPFCQTRLLTRTAFSRPIRALILTPTRELALQIYENFEGYGKKLLDYSLEQAKLLGCVLNNVYSTGFFSGQGSGNAYGHRRFLFPGLP